MSFDRLAQHYHWMEFLAAGEKLQRCRTAFLDRVTEAQRVLIAGEGNGRFLAAFRCSLPNARITVVDSSRRMLEAARNRVIAQTLELEDIEFIHADLLKWAPRSEAYDLIVTHFFLDCFPAGELKQIIARLSSCATRDAQWLLADFQIPDRGWRRSRAKAIHSLMYAFFRVATRLPARRLTPPRVFLENHAFALREKRTFEWGLLHSDLWVR